MTSTSAKWLTRCAVLLLVVIMSSLSWFGVQWLRGAIRREGPIVQQCHRDGQTFGRETAPQPYWDCLRKRAQSYVEREFVDIKDLAKAFLTLVSGVLVFSLTFSEKLVDLNRAGLGPRVLIVLCWLGLLAAIIDCGGGLVLMSSAANWAGYEPDRDYFQMVGLGKRMIVQAGGFFCLALVSMFFAALAAGWDRWVSTRGSVSGIGTSPP